MSWNFETNQIHAGQQPDPTTGARALPIYQTTSYVFESAQQAADRFALKDQGPIYSRLTNPTWDVVEARLATLEGGVGALLTSSGAGAISLSILTIAQAGDNIVASPSLYGGTTNLFVHTLPKYGIETRLVEDPHDIESWKALADERTVAFYGETIPNPAGDILDLEPLAKAAHEVGVPLIVDNTVPTPYLLRPIEWGADIVVHSATKYLGGHGTSVLGVIVDSGNFDWTKEPERFVQFNQPDPSYHGLTYGPDLGNQAFILKARAQGLRDLGFSASPFNAFLIEQGIETLSLRIERHVDNALKIAQYLEKRKNEGRGVDAISYSGLESSPYYELAKKYTPRGAGALVSFDITGGREVGEKFVDNLPLFSNLANIGDVRSLVAHPASTTHSQLEEEGLKTAGITGGTIRLAVGIENVEDLIDALETAFKAVGL